MQPWKTYVAPADNPPFRADYAARVLVFSHLGLDGLSVSMRLV